jgi:acyl-CoA synthetase (AMP-forming)/AMP-acid ligase II
MLMGDILELNVIKEPERLALVTEAGEFTFAQLHERARRLVAAMGQLGAPGDRVAILSQNNVEYVDAYYGVPSAGMALVFLNYRLNPHELAWIVDNSQARILLVEHQFLQSMLDVRDQIPTVEHVVVIGGPATGRDGVVAYDDLLASADPAPELPRPQEDDVAWQLYTSGTTGRPKGAMLTHRSLITAVLNAIIAYDVQRDDRSLMCFPMCHVSGYLVTQHHMVGASVVLMRAYEPGAWFDLVDQHQITASGLAPTMMTVLLQHPGLHTHDLSTLRSIGYGAAAMPVEVLKAAIERFGPVVWSGFGMTELGGNVLMHPVSAHVRAVNGEEHLLASCGIAMPFAAVRVVDEDMKELPPGEVGEIIVRGEQLLSGYWDKPEATAEAFKGGWFHTGDLARRDEEGFFYIVDRMKDMIITGGENVYSREVEEILYAHPAVSEAAVIGLPDEKWGERVAAVITLRAGAAATDAEIVRFCREKLAGFKTPREVLFVDEIPKNVSGKVLKRELRDRFAGA